MNSLLWKTSRLHTSSAISALQNSPGCSFKRSQTTLKRPTMSYWCAFTIVVISRDLVLHSGGRSEIATRDCIQGHRSKPYWFQMTPSRRLSCVNGKDSYITNIQSADLTLLSHSGMIIPVWRRVSVIRAPLMIVQQWGCGGQGDRY